MTGRHSTLCIYIKNATNDVIMWYFNDIYITSAHHSKICTDV